MSKTITNKEYRELLFTSELWDIMGEGLPKDIVQEDRETEAYDGSWSERYDELLEEYPDEKGEDK